jgi:hypothetical protein
MTCKGKVYKKYKLGCKVSVFTMSKDKGVVGTEALHNRQSLDFLLFQFLSRDQPHLYFLKDHALTAFHAF